MKSRINDREAYARVVEAFKKRGGSATAADVVAFTGLPLDKVKECLPAASDEYGARLRVTESGEVLYSFPDGFRSRYRGFGPWARRAAAAAGKGAAKAGTFLFKAWIALMLVGYFAVFVAIALVALLASIAASMAGSSDERSSSRRGGGMAGFYLASRVLDLVVRIWFYSEWTRAIDGGPRYRADRSRRPPARPLHKAVFSFVFGDGDPDAGWETRERTAVLAYIKANRGLIALPEFMALTGLPPAEAERAISTYLLEYGGYPEATDDGTVVYRFEEILRGSEAGPSTLALAPPLKRTKPFSSNPKKANAWFVGLNGINLAFGAYFLACSLAVGPILSDTAVSGATYLYAIAYILASGLGDPAAITAVGLGVVPLAFAVLFYLIPAARSVLQAKENEGTRFSNFRKAAYRAAWNSPAALVPSSVAPADAESRPADLAAARDAAVKELGQYAMPEVSLSPSGETVYAFPDLERDRASLAKARAAVRLEEFKPGATIFDSHGQ